MNPHNIKVGQTLHHVTIVNRSKFGDNDRPVTVTKIGRKWGYIDYGHNTRFNLETMYEDGGIYSNPAKLYIDKNEYFKERDHKKAWEDLSNKIHGMFYGKPKLTMDEISECAKLFKVTLGMNK